MDSLGGRRAAAGHPRGGGRRRSRLDAVLRDGTGRQPVLRQGAGTGSAQRRPAVPDVPRDPAQGARRRAAVLLAAAGGRARGVRRPGGTRPRDPHAAHPRLRTRPSRTRSCSPTRPSPGVRSTVCSPTRSPTRCSQAIWTQIADLRAHRIAHRDLRLANVFLADDGEVWMIDFGFSEVAASDLLLANDVAELVASSSVVVGAERATRTRARPSTPTTLARAPRSIAAVGAERGDPYGAEGAARAARRPARPTRPAMNPAWLALSAGGLVVLVLSTIEARRDRPSRRGKPGCSAIDQPVAGLALRRPVAADAARQPRRGRGGRARRRRGRPRPRRRRRRRAGGAVEAGHRAVHPPRDARLSHASGCRPGTSQPGAILRGDVPVAGPSFPSGHAILVAAIGSVIGTRRPHRAGLGAVPVHGPRDGRSRLRRCPQPARRDGGAGRRVAARRRARRLRRGVRSFTRSGGEVRRSPHRRLRCVGWRRRCRGW